MKRIVLFVGILAVALLPRFASAEDHDGNELSKECGVALKWETTTARGTLNDSLNVGVCVGLVRGIIDTMRIWTRMDINHQEDIAHGCIPNEVTPMEGIKVVAKYLNDNPQELHRLDTALAWSALLKAYPCGK